MTLLDSDCGPLFETVVKYSLQLWTLSRENSADASQRGVRALGWCPFSVKGDKGRRHEEEVTWNANVCYFDCGLSFYLESESVHAYELILGVVCWK